MAVYVIMDVDIFDIGHYMNYMKQVRPLLEAAGARYLARGGAFQVLEGDYHPTRLVIIEFPSTAVMEDFYASADYLELKALRDSCSSSNVVAVEGLE